MTDARLDAVHAVTLGAGLATQEARVDAVYALTLGAGLAAQQARVDAVYAMVLAAPTNITTNPGYWGIPVS